VEQEAHQDLTENDIVRAGTTNPGRLPAGMLFALDEGKTVRAYDG
jgi:hypothetical protein